MINVGPEYYAYTIAYSKNEKKKNNTRKQASSKSETINWTVNPSIRNLKPWNEPYKTQTSWTERFLWILRLGRFQWFINAPNYNCMSLTNQTVLRYKIFEIYHT